MSKNDIDERIEELNQDLDPFFLMSHDDGIYSLCLDSDELNDDGRAAFNAYAKEAGKLVRDEQGFYAYGSGYDWEAAFREAFKYDPNLKRIHFDCESGGFYCYGFDLEMMANFGKRFKELCADTERFIPIVSEGIRQYDNRWAEAERQSHTIRGRIWACPKAEFEVKTPQGEFKVEAGEGKELLEGTRPSIISKTGDVELPAEDFLNQTVTVWQRDLFEKYLFRLKVESQPELEPEQEETLAPSLEL